MPSGPETTNKLKLSDIARKAGVSPATVSRVVNNYPHVSDEVRARVLRVIEVTGYHPNMAARSLASQRSGIIGLVIPRSVHAFFTDPYFPRLTEGIAQACNRHNCTLALFLICTEEDERKLLPRLTSQGIADGVIIQATHMDDKVLTSVMEGDLPFVVAGRPLASENVNYIDVDNVAGARTAVTHLIQAGKMRIGTITGALTSNVGLDRLEGYRQALAARSMAAGQELIVEGDFTEAGGYYAMQTLLPQAPDGLFIASDAMALGALRALREAGQTVPDDIAVVSFDDLPPATQATPSLTTVRQPIRRFGAKAVDLLLDVMADPTRAPQRVIFGTELVVRESCGTGLASGGRA